MVQIGAAVAASKVEVAVVAASKAAAASKVEVAAVVGKWQKAEIAVVAIEPAGVAAENSLCNCLSLFAGNKDAAVKGLGWQARG